MFWVVDQLWTP